VQFNYPDKNFINRQWYENIGLIIEIHWDN